MLRETRQRLASAFTPTRPLTRFQDGASRNPSAQGQAGFDGGEAERERIARAFIEDRSHILVYGERGRSKTWLANLVIAQAEAAEFFVARHVCSATSNFDAIMRGLLHDMSHGLAGGDPSGASKPPDVADLVPPDALQPSDVLTIFGSLRDRRILLLIDGFDRVEDAATRTAVADTIKQLSDRDLPILFVIVGASDSPEALLGRHPSIQRCVTRVALPLLTQAQVEHLVEQGAAQAGLEFTPAARICIAELARGLPYMAQLLSLRAGQAALDNGRTAILGGDLLAAIEAAAIEADPRILALHDLATQAGSDAAALAVLRAAAAGPHDALGRFKAVPDGPSIRVAGIRVDPAAWHRVLTLGAIEAIRGEEPGLFAFAEALLPQLVLLRAVLSRQAAAEPAMPEVTEV